jgi:hypothetical protein
MWNVTMSGSNLLNTLMIARFVCDNIVQNIKYHVTYFVLVQEDII